MSKNDARALSIGSFAVAVAALFFAAILLITRTSDQGTAASPSEAAIETIAVNLGAMKIEPAELNIPTVGAHLK
ncbi:MAG: hypothetical protein F2795_09830, partial [Actinobacteria bacterium]|nr:hypothetical protein [Actinomycetota bacterium]